MLTDWQKYSISIAAYELISKEEFAHQSLFFSKEKHFFLEIYFISNYDSINALISFRLNSLYLIDSILILGYIFIHA